MVRRTSQANDDLIDIWVFIAQKSPMAADRFLDTINEKCHLLGDAPELGARREELAPGLRSFPIGNYTIFYRPIQNGIEIIRVLSSFRDIDPIFDD